jgi:hypothetical protein
LAIGLGLALFAFVCAHPFAARKEVSMGIRYARQAVATAVLASWLTIGQSSTQTQTGATGEVDDIHESPITLIGCIQREVDYRRTHALGRGGVAARGLGRGNEYALITAFRAEYVLIDASHARSEGATANIDCSFQSTAEVYELTGDREHDLAPFVGRVVQISGMLKEVDVEPVGTSGQTAPTGGFDPLEQDLQLHAVNVTSFQEISTTAKAPQAPTAPAAEPAPTPTTGVEEQRPRTSSPLPLAALLGLLLLGGALGLWALRRG